MRINHAAGTDPIMPRDSRYNSESGRKLRSSSRWKVMLTCGIWWRSTAQTVGVYSVWVWEVMCVIVDILTKRDLLFWLATNIRDCFVKFFFITFYVYFMSLFFPCHFHWIITKNLRFNWRRSHQELFCCHILIIDLKNVTISCIMFKGHQPLCNPDWILILITKIFHQLPAQFQITTPNRIASIPCYRNNQIIIQN